MQGVLEKFNLRNLPKKHWTFFAGFLVSGIVFWLYLFNIFTSRVLVFWGVASGIIWLCFAGICMLFLNKRLLFVAYIIFGILVLTLFGFRGFNITGIIIFWLATLWAHNRAERMKNSLSSFREVYITRKFFPIFLTGLAFLLAFVWQSFILNNGKLDEPPQISQKSFHWVFVPVDSLVVNIVPGYSSGMTIGGFQDALNNEFLSKLFLMDTKSIETFFGSSAEPKTDAQQKFLALTMEDFARTWLNTNIKNTLSPYLGLAPAFIILGLFLVFKFVFWYLKWIVLAIIFVAIKLMKMYNILVIKKVQSTKDVPVL